MNILQNRQNVLFITAVRATEPDGLYLHLLLFGTFSHIIFRYKLLRAITVIKDNDTGSQSYKSTRYTINGFFHREKFHADDPIEGPAFVSTEPRSSTLQWFFAGRPHSYDDKPAVINYIFVNGVEIEQKWYNHGIFIRKTVTSPATVRKAMIGQ